MSKKTALWSIGLVIIASAAFWLVASLGRQESPAAVGPDGECLLFQSQDPGKPCYFPVGDGAPMEIPDQSGEDAPDSEDAAYQATSTPGEIAGCSGSAIERDGCISDAARDNDDIGLCSYVQGALARTACERGVRESPLSAAVSTSPATESAYEAYIKSSAFAAAPRAASRPSGGVGTTSRPSAFDSIVLSGTSQGFTIEDFYKKTAYEAAVAVYAVFPYQSKPGDSVRLTGSGFALDATNVVYVGGQSVSGIASPDGMTLTFAMPSASEGTHEVWVANARGSSRVASRPIYAVVSSSPVPPPVIASVSPANPKSVDTVTLSGTNLSGIQGVYTTLGRAPGNSLSFRPADLEYVSLVGADGSLEGQKVSLYIYVLAEGGLSEQPFIVDVQF